MHQFRNIFFELGIFSPSNRICQEYTMKQKYPNKNVLILSRFVLQRVFLQDWMANIQWRVLQILQINEESLARRRQRLQCRR